MEAAGNWRVRALACAARWYRGAVTEEGAFGYQRDAAASDGERRECDVTGDVDYFSFVFTPIAGRLCGSTQEQICRAAKH